MKKLLLLVIVAFPCDHLFSQQQHTVKNLRITILSTMMTQQYGTGEWAGLKRGECVVGSIGATFQPDKGFQSGPLTK